MAHTAPTAAELKAAFPAFAAVDDAQVNFNIVRANRSVDATWTEGDYATAIMLLACHYMVLAGLGTGGEAQVNAQGLAGFRVIRSASLTLERGATSGTDGGGVPDEYSGSTYGRQFWSLLRQNKTGVAVAASPAVQVPPAYPYPFGYFGWPYYGG